MIALRLGTFGILLLLLLPAVAPAQPPPITTPLEAPTEIEEEEEPRSALRVGLSLFGTAGTYSMQEFNKRIDDATILIRDQWGAPEIRLDTIEGGVGYGVGILAFWRNTVMLALDYERVGGKSDVGGRLGASDIQVPAKAYLVTLGYSILATDVIRFGFAAGGGYYDADGTVRFQQREENVEKLALGGTAIGQHYAAFVDAPLPGHFGFFVMIGYRRAEVTDLEITVDVIAPPDTDPDWEPPFSTDPSGNSLDWSGFMSRGALIYYF